MRSAALLAAFTAATLAFTPATLGFTPAATAAPQSPARVLHTATLPDIPLGQFSNRLLPGTVDDDRGVALGGIGSDLYPTGLPGEFWTLTDRGPNGQIKVDKVNRRTFPVPGFDPAIVRVRAWGSTLRVVQAIPLTTRHGKPVTGLPNQPGRDETPYTYDASTPLGFNPDGVDTEGLVRAHDGTFWLVEEYGPSLLHVSAGGRVLARYVPRGLNLTGTDYPVIEALPSILLARQNNRGFEGIALLPGGDLILGVQSPLSLPDKKTAGSTRTVRFVRFSTKRQQVTAEYVYRFDPVDVIDPSAGGDQSEAKISALIGLGHDKILVEERTDNAARVYSVDLRRATDILGGRWDSPTTSPSLEQLSDPATELIVTPAKKLVVDLASLPGVPKKVEGLALVAPGLLAVINDNDFGMTDGPGAFDPAGRLVDSGVETQLLFVAITGSRGV